MRNGALEADYTSVFGRCGRVVAVAACASLLLGADVADAQGSMDGAGEPADVTGECVDAFGQAQTLRDDGKLVEARKALESCARAECPDVVTSKCMPWLEQVNADLPSIVVVAKDAQGNDVVDVRVLLGETVLTESLDGRPLDLDPGAHTLRFEHGDAPAVEQQIVARQGEKLRSIEVRFAGPDAPAPGPDPSATTPPPTTPSPGAPAASADEGSSGGVSPLVYIGFPLAGAGLVVGSIAGIAAMGAASDLKDKCTTMCEQAEIDDANNVALVSTFGFVAAGVGTLLGVIGIFASSSDEEAAETSSLRPLVGPGLVGLRGRF